MANTFHWNSNVRSKLIDPISRVITKVALPVASIFIPELAAINKIGTAVQGAASPNAGGGLYVRHQKKLNRKIRVGGGTFTQVMDAM